MDGEKLPIPRFEILSDESGRTKILFDGKDISDCVTGYTISQRGGDWRPLLELEIPVLLKCKTPVSLKTNGDMVVSDGD